MAIVEGKLKQFRKRDYVDTPGCIGDRHEFIGIAGRGAKEAGYKYADFQLKAIRALTDSVPTLQSMARAYAGTENKPGTCLKAEGVLRTTLAAWRFEKAKTLLGLGAGPL